MYFLAQSVSGKDGRLEKVFITGYRWDAESKRNFPLTAINIIRRQAENLLLSNSDSRDGKESLEFILSLASRRRDMDSMKHGKKCCHTI